MLTKEQITDAMEWLNGAVNSLDFYCLGGIDEEPVKYIKQALQLARDSVWQPIDDVAKNEKDEFLVRAGEHVAIAIWVSLDMRGNGYWFGRAYNAELTFQPKEYMRVPQPPQQKESK